MDYKALYELRTEVINEFKEENKILATIVKELKEENEKLKEQVEDAHQKGFDAGREEYQVDTEYLEEKDDEIKELRNFKANVTKLLFDDLDLPEGVQHNDRDLYDCIEGLRNLQTGFDEHDPENGEFVKHHPSYKELKEQVGHLRCVHSQVVQDLNARTEQVIELTLQHELTLHHE